MALKLLPNEIVVEVACYCSVLDLLAITKTSKRFSFLLNVHDLWVKQVQLYWPYIYLSLVDLEGHQEYPSRWDWTAGARLHREFFYRLCQIRADKLGGRYMAKGSPSYSPFDPFVHQLVEYKEHNQVMDFIRENRQHPQLLGLAFYALKRMMYREEPNVYFIEADLLVSGNAAVVLELLQTFSDRSSMMHEAFGMLGNAATHQPMRAFFSKSSLPATIVNALKKFPNERLLFQDALFCTRNCIQGNPAALNQFVKQGLIPPLLRTFAHWKTPRMCKDAVKIVADLTYYDEKYCAMLIEQCVFLAIEKYILETPKSAHF